MSNKSAETIVAELLAARGIPAEDQAQFRSPDFSRDTHSAWKLPGIEAAVARLLAAHEKQESIIIFGDYDADGVPATALLVRVLKRLGFENIKGIIPTRFQGYGLTPAVVEELLSHNPGILITVDNGTVAKEEVAMLSAAGVDVIVIDHHEPQEGKVADKALAIINPKMPASVYPFRDLCACALAWKCGVALTEKLQGDPTALKWDLDLVGLSTIADMVPLLGENRVLASFGLTVLRKSRNAGLRALMEVSGVIPEKASASDVGFKLAPRINAPSRLHDELLHGEHSALSLLTSDNPAQALEIARHLNSQNAERQGLVDVHLTEAENQVAGSKALVLVAYHDSWSSGVIGLVASRLVERYKRPVVVLAPEGGEIKGSVRSVDGIHALELLESGEAELERFGGHAKAAGLTLKGSVDSFRELLEAYMLTQGLTLETVAKGAERPTDGELELGAVTLDLAEALEGLEPFGIGFPTPVFTVEATVKNVRPVGAQGQHLSFFLTDGLVDRKAISFSYRGPKLEDGMKCRCSTVVKPEEWRDVRSVVCQVKRVELLGAAEE